MATITYKCPSCGGGLKFNPILQKYKCEYCLSDFTQEDLERLAPSEAADQVETAESADLDGGTDSVQQNGLLYTCPSCGAEIVTDDTTAATFCYYCHNPVVLSGKLKGNYHPDYVMPFAIDRKGATRIFTEWIKKKRYVPKAFFSKDQIEKLTGVYFPYWLYSCEVDGELDAQGMKLRVWTLGNIRYTETQKFDVQRKGRMEVNNVTRNALKKANRQLAEGVLPYKMEEVKPFSMGYLSGFIAEKRDMEQVEFEQDVAGEVRDFAVNSLKNSVGAYDKVNIVRSQAQIEAAQWKYALMPVWTLTYRDSAKDKIYYFALNGQTGKICGELPVDKKRLALLFMEVFFPVLFTLLLLGYFI